MPALARDVTQNEDKDRMSVWLTLVGIGEEGYPGLGQTARQALRKAQHIIGAPRQLQLLPNSLQARTEAWPQPFSVEPVLSRHGQPLCVLASGDPMLFGVGASLARHVPAEEFEVLPAPSSCSLAAARLGWALQDATLISLVGRPITQLNLHLHPGARLLILSSDGRSPAAVAELLRIRGFGPSPLWVFEHLGGSKERCISGQAAHWSLPEVAALNLVAVECQPGEQPQCLPCTPGLPDDAYQHDGQLTKRDVRAVTLARLAPKPGELLWDVGAGCGSISIEWLRSHPKCRAIAIETDDKRAQLIRHNAEALGVPQLQLVQGQAPAALAGLETPDALFIGGGLTEAGLLEYCWHALKPGGRLLANAVTLQSEALLLDWHSRYGGELLRLQVAHAKPLGSFSTWRSTLPITLLDIHKPHA